LVLKVPQFSGKFLPLELQSLAEQGADMVEPAVYIPSSIGNETWRRRDRLRIAMTIALAKLNCRGMSPLARIK
jgi:hypothetical protein